MLLEGSSVRVLQCSPLPTDTGAVFNSFSKQSCLHTNCSLSSYLCPAVCFQEILFKQARTCHWNQLNFSDTSASWAHERISLFSQYRQGNLVKLCIFWVEPPFLHEGSFQLERCTTQGVVSVGRYQTEPRWFSSCVKSYVGTLSLEPSDISMLHSSCNRYLYIVLYHYIIITPLPTYLPRYLLHMKAGPTLPTSGDSNCFGSDPKLSKFFRSEALHRSSSVDPAGCFQEILFKQTGACHWKKFGSKCDAFGADMSSKTSAPGTSCSKEPVLRIGFMNHHRDCWEKCKIGFCHRNFVTCFRSLAAYCLVWSMKVVATMIF